MKIKPGKTAIVYTTILQIAVLFTLLTLKLYFEFNIHWSLVLLPGYWWTPYLWGMTLYTSFNKDEKKLK